ncbi:MAG: hypothetical protein ACHQUC_02685 [Chlamydiales bacterium]
MNIHNQPVPGLVGLGAPSAPADVEGEQASIIASSLSAPTAPASPTALESELAGQPVDRSEVLPPGPQNGTGLDTVHRPMDHGLTENVSSLLQKELRSEERPLDKVDDRAHEIANLVLVWKEVKGELGLLKRIIRSVTFQSKQTEIYQKILFRVEKAVAERLETLITESAPKDESQKATFVHTFLRDQLAKEKPDFSAATFDQNDVNRFITQLQLIETIQSTVVDSATIPDPIFDAAIQKLKTEQDGVLIGPELDTSRTFLGYPLFYVQNFISDAIKGNITWPILRPANSRLLKPLWKAIASKVGVPSEGLSAKDIFSMHMQGMKILKQKFAPIEALFISPHKTTDPLLNQLLMQRNLTPEKLAEFKEGRFAEGENAKDFSKAFRGVLTEYFQNITGELIHPEGEDFTSLNMFLKTMENHFIILEESAKEAMEDDVLFNSFSGCLTGELCFNAKDRHLQDFHSENIVPRILENWKTKTSEDVLRQQLSNYLVKDAKGDPNYVCPLTPGAIKGMVANGDLTYGVSFGRIETANSTSTDFDQMFTSIMEQLISEGRITPPTDDEWKTKAKNPLEDYISATLEQVKGKESYDEPAIREMLQGYAMMDKWKESGVGILEDLMEKAMRGEDGQLKELGVVEFMDILKEGRLTHGIPITDIMAVGSEKMTDDDLEAFINFQVDSYMMEDDRA